MIIAWKTSSYLVTCVMEARGQAQLKVADKNSPEREGPCDVQDLINSLKLDRGCWIHGIPVDSYHTFI
jgi:hypothetical protein